jgi:hypothetical protein
MPPIRSAPRRPVVPAKPDSRWLSGRVGVAALLGGGLLGAAPLVGRVAGADPQALVGLALVAFVGSGLALAGVMILLRWTLRRGGWWYAAAAGLVLALGWWLLGLLPAITGP